MESVIHKKKRIVKDFLFEYTRKDLCNKRSNIMISEVKEIRVKIRKELIL